ncbi:MAG: hypothetical protein K2W96_06585 [Gemmataceae bacterium]|nr:hypothetical protein [Gemmataceae bacterium]
MQNAASPRVNPARPRPAKGKPPSQPPEPKPALKVASFSRWMALCA